MSPYAPAQFPERLINGPVGNARGFWLTKAVPLSELTRLKALFFAYFAYVGILSPYLSLYFSGQGYTVAQIGVLMTVPNLLRIVSPPFWGWMADQSGRSDRLLRISTVLTVSCVALLPVASDLGYLACVGLLGLMFFVSGAQVPIGEARTLALTGGDSGQYGRIRLWGSIGFIAAVVLGGPVLDALGTLSLPLWAALPLLLLLTVVWGARELPATEKSNQVVIRLRDRFLQPYIAAFFVANFLMIFAHAALYVLFSLYLESHGYSKSVIGLLWAVGVVAEVVLFRCQRPLFERFGALTLLSFSLFIAALRFAAVGLSDGAFVVIIATQLMHMVTFGLHHSAVMKLLHQWFAPAQQARAQATYLTIAYGLGGTIGGLALTTVWSTFSAQMAFFAAGLIASLGWLAPLCCIRWHPTVVAVSTPQRGG
ncbi:MAG: MFS transporter [Burkholderiaceae bacterium]